MTGKMILNVSELELLYAYALPHMRLPTDKAPLGTFRRLVEKGLVREGVGKAVMPMTMEELHMSGDETPEEFEAKLKPYLIDTPGWVITNKAIGILLLVVDPGNEKKAEAVMRAFIADEDPAGPYDSATRA